MKFRHRIHNMVYVVPSKEYVLEPFGKQYRRAPKIQYRVEFGEHQWDSLQGQKLYGWTDEERAHVEEYLQAHKDFGVPGSLVSGIGGLFLEDEGMLLQPEDMRVESGNEQIARDKQKRCIYTVQKPNGTLEQCGKFIKKDSESGLCPTHEKALEDIKS